MPRLEPVFRGHMDGKRNVVLEDKNAYYIWRCHFKKDQEVELILRKKRKRRTKPQNSYLWGVVYPVVSECTGFTDDEVHSAMKMLFLRVHRDKLPDTVKSTRELSTEEFSDYVKAIQQWAAEQYGAYIPDPGEVNL
jgi:hypothetical protein